MGVKKETLIEMIRGRRFRDLFREHLGWDTAAASPLSLSFDWAGEKQEFTADYIAEKHGFVVCEAQCKTMPPAAVRQRLQRQMSKLHYEHLLILSGEDGGQKWMVAHKRSDKPMRFLEVGFHATQEPELLLQKIGGLFISMKEEGRLTLVDVVGRVESTFAANAETVTRKFYREFRNQLDQFQNFIQGLQGRISREYASLMLDRLMFTYFIQKKRFLNDNLDYLREQLKTARENWGEDNFYRRFLIKFFHDGLGAPMESRSQATNDLLGNVPYLNGGLFDRHIWERQHGADIQIPDTAFFSLFDFFDKWKWHLDERPIASGKDINPDVIGYIFERYINKRAEMGAYYTREDITGYIARNTILPHLLRRAKDGCKVAFDSKNGTIWKLLRKNPRRYIYRSMQKGIDLPDSELPEDIRVGLDSQIPDLLKRREKWNAAADEEWALPSETWRKVLERRRQCNALIADIKAGRVCDIADLTVRNLNIEKLTLDMLQQHEGTDLITTFYTAVAGRTERENSPAQERRGITILDPACGSGAFLFAAMNVLEPLYKMCVTRMREFVAEANQLEKPKQHEHFRAVLKDMNSHVNEKYWIYHSIILKNLFGADIMPEAAEVAKLRLFLKLAAAAEKDDKKPNMGLEPLPDIDFNIRSGNALVGFASIGEFEEQASGVLNLDGETIKGITDAAEDVGKIYERFVEKQGDGVISDIGSDSFHQVKDELHLRLTKLNSRLNDYLAKSYLPASASLAKIAAWKESHKPFHWASEFYGIVESGGFDVVIGNPPYVETSKINYGMNGFSSAKGNLYSYFMEKSAKSLLQDGGDFGMIVPISLPSTQRQANLRKFLSDRFPFLLVANFADRPGSLFSGVHQKVSIALGGKSSSKGFYTTNFLHWYGRTNSGERENLLERLHYQESDSSLFAWPKFGQAIERKIWQKICSAPPAPLFVKSRRTGDDIFYLNKRLMFWVKCFHAPKASKEFKSYQATGCPAASLIAAFNSSTFFWFWEVVSDGWDLLNNEKHNFRFAVKGEGEAALVRLARELEDDLEAKKAHVGTVQTDYEYYHHKSKPIIDEIDKILAKHYGFSAEELDYIINYDYKYRMSGGDE